MSQLFGHALNFHALNLLDLLEAREAYHVHLAHLDNVVATAVGLYRIRISEIRKVGKVNAARIKPKAASDDPRTLANSRIIPGYSWPCVMVFVREWQHPEDFSTAPDQAVPRRLYLPDGRMIPVCVILAERADEAMQPTPVQTFPSIYTGGGFPVVSKVQGRNRLGSVGCLVTNGRETFALTNRHVAGNPGDRTETVIRGSRVAIGVSVDTRVGKLPFTQAFPGWPGSKSLCNLDAGLIRLDDLSQWTAQVYGVGEIGEPIDLNTDTLSLGLIGTPVRAFGAASGPMKGEIQALFYRYKAIGGFDYITDVLIGPRLGGKPFPSRHGDSGTLWFYDPLPKPAESQDERHEPLEGAQAPRLRPLALQWGGHTLLGAGGEQAIRFVLASCVSTVCRVLDVELIRDLSLGLPETWGETGHFEIAAKALTLPADKKLRKLLELNKNNIARTDAALRAGHLGAERGEFVPLADVADLVWRTTRPADGNNHFADMDRVATSGKFAGESLLTLFAQDRKTVDPQIWLDFYADLPEVSPETEGPEKPGALPFRVWQIYDEMVRALAKDGDLVRFVCAGGLLAHYVGDACQPLHVSRLHHGNDPSQKNVHSDYETRMLDNAAVQVDLFEKIDKALAPKVGKVKKDLRGGREAAVSVVRLMKETIQQLPPKDVIESWNHHRGRGRFQAMWQDLGTRTSKCMAAGCVRLAALWQSAWEEGGGDRLSNRALRKIDQDDLMDLYNDPSFLPSRSLKKMIEAGFLRNSLPNNSNGEATGESPDGGRPHQRHRLRSHVG
jgi:hypothetical protein